MYSRGDDNYLTKEILVTWVLEHRGGRLQQSPHGAEGACCGGRTAITVAFLIPHLQILHDIDLPDSTPESKKAILPLFEALALQLGNKTG